MNPNLGRTVRQKFPPRHRLLTTASYVTIAYHCSMQMYADVCSMLQVCLFLSRPRPMSGPLSDMLIPLGIGVVGWQLSDRKRYVSDWSAPSRWISSWRGVGRCWWFTGSLVLKHSDTVYRSIVAFFCAGIETSTGARVCVLCVRSNSATRNCQYDVKISIQSWTYQIFVYAQTLGKLW